MKHRLALAVILVAYVAVLWVTAPAIGFTRDEGYYFKAAGEYFGWFAAVLEDPAKAVSTSTIDAYFTYNHEHPALVKLVQGGFHALLHDTLGSTSHAQGYRAAGFFFAALTLFATYLLGRVVAGPVVGLAAALLMTAMPRFFFDAHLATFDVPITAMWTLSLATFWWMWSAQPKVVSSRALAVGVIFGLSLSTKLNALFLPIVFVAVWLHEPPAPWIPRLAKDAVGSRVLTLPSIPLSLVIIAIVGCLVFLATWPWLWPDPWPRLLEYLRFHLRHEHYPISYFHTLHVEPPFPWSFPWIMTLFTVPSGILLAAVLGLVERLPGLWRRDGRSMLLLAGALLPIVLISMPSTPIFGGTKHWYNALPACAFVRRGSRNER
ncbi:MAG: hypothetical protein HC923_00955 [Myxococcales bacterium]|nr:hypothetical protein [Myxococcales bacterium]